MEKTIKILICGLGSIGTYYVRLINSKWPNSRISILRTGNGKNKKEELLAENIFFDEFKARDWKPDFCIISSPACFHLEQALFFGKDSIPLLIEKPIGVPFQSKEKWKELELINKKSPIYVGYVLRHDPCLKLLKKYVSNHLIGEIVEADFYSGSWLPNWRKGIDYKETVSARKEYGGGVLLELSHEIDLALWIFGDLKLHSSFINNSKIFEIDVEDQAYLFGTSNDGVNISLRLNFCSNIERRNVLIRGTNGEIICDIKNGFLYYKLSNGEEKKIKMLNSKDIIFKSQLEVFFNKKDNLFNDFCNIKDGLAVLKIIEESLTMNKIHSKS